VVKSDIENTIVHKSRPSMLVLFVIDVDKQAISNEIANTIHQLNKTTATTTQAISTRNIKNSWRKLAVVQAEVDMDKPQDVLKVDREIHGNNNLNKPWSLWLLGYALYPLSSEYILTLLESSCTLGISTSCCPSTTTGTRVCGSCATTRVIIWEYVVVWPSSIDGSSSWPCSGNGLWRGITPSTYGEWIRSTSSTSRWQFPSSASPWWDVPTSSTSSVDSLAKWFGLWCINLSGSVEF
jgi:hypothetical protein